jgi:hypothetical protein
VLPVYEPYELFEEPAKQVAFFTPSAIASACLYRQKEAVAAWRSCHEMCTPTFFYLGFSFAYNIKNKIGKITSNY